jgi:hypothetical protein
MLLRKKFLPHPGVRAPHQGSDRGRAGAAGRGQVGPSCGGHGLARSDGGQPGGGEHSRAAVGTAGWGWAVAGAAGQGQAVAGGSEWRRAAGMSGGCG